MRRVVSVWLPTWPTDRLRRRGEQALPSPSRPLVTSMHDGRRDVVAGADRAAQALGLRPGMPLAAAQAAVPDLAVVEADPEGDRAALRRLAAWCLRYTPLASIDPPDGLWLDITGCAHAWGGEGPLLRDLLDRCGQSGLAARAAVASAPGTAYAVARYGAGRGPVLVEPGAERDVLAELPVAALRLAPEVVDGLRRLGLERMGHLCRAPRAPLARRFGAALLLRLDQALGRVFEPIEPEVPAEAVQRRAAFVEPLLTAEAFSTAIACLVPPVCAALEASGQGARQVALLFERVDGAVLAVRVGTSRPTRDVRHLARMLDERLEEVDPGLGVEAMRLVVQLAEPLAWAQQAAALAVGERPWADLSGLVDRLANRLGPERVWRMAPVESDLPERSLTRVGPLETPEQSWPAELLRPVRLLHPPQPVETISGLPDGPPVSFTWRRIRRRVRRAAGPERVHGEWWRSEAEAGAVRDYWRVEDEDGRRWWLFRRGDGEDPGTGDLQWFLHGLF